MNIKFVLREGADGGDLGFAEFRLVAITPARIHPETGRVENEYHILCPHDVYTTCGEDEWTDMMEDYEAPNIEAAPPITLPQILTALLQMAGIEALIRSDEDDYDETLYADYSRLKDTVMPILLPLTKRMAAAGLFTLCLDANEAAFDAETFLLPDFLHVGFDVAHVGENGNICLSAGSSSQYMRASDNPTAKRKTPPTEETVESFPCPH
jgi:hypothetical protein